MKASFKYSILTLLVISFISISSCKDFRKFKESRAELKKEKQEDKEAKEKTEIADTAESSSEIIEESKENKTDSLFFAYERTPCFGRCPIFKMKVYNSGRATYDGTNFVDNIGYFQTQLNKETIDGIESALKQADFFWLQDSYDNDNVTDLPSRIIEVNKNGKYKKVIARYQFPDELKQLFKNLDNLFETIEWEPHSEN